jgi:hypothetical protein
MSYAVTSVDIATTQGFTFATTSATLCSTSPTGCDTGMITFEFVSAGGVVTGAAVYGSTGIHPETNTNASNAAAVYHLTRPFKRFTGASFASRVCLRVFNLQGHDSSRM